MGFKRTAVKVDTRHLTSQITFLQGLDSDYCRIQTGVGTLDSSSSWITQLNKTSVFTRFLLFKIGLWETYGKHFNI